jgi:hypothetical protein
MYIVFGLIFLLKNCITFFFVWFSVCIIGLKSKIDETWMKLSYIPIT